jgi:hypothetical protein
MKNPNRGRTAHIRNLMDELDICYGQIGGLLDARDYAGVERVTGPIDQQSLSELKTTIQVHHSHLGIEDQRDISSMDEAAQSSSERRLTVREETSSNIENEIGKTTGLRGSFGLHKKNIAHEIAKRALQAVDAASAITRIERAPANVSDPFGRRPKVSEYYFRPENDSPSW